MNFPYSYLTSPDVLGTGHPIPDRKYFDNDLTAEKISDEDWSLVHRICVKFHIQDFRSYTRLYTILDTVLLAIVYENFRASAFNVYGLDPTYTCTASSYGWQALLYQTGAVVDYIRDGEMLKKIQDGVRGGPCFSTKKIVQANNERTPLGFDPSKPSTHLCYFDVVSLYAHAMCGKFPVDGYQWVDYSAACNIDWSDDSVGSDGVGCILSVDLEYPHELHEPTSLLPLAPEKKCIRLE